MPTYEYECKDCSHTFEVFQAISDPPVKECPKCGQEVRRLILGGAGVIFKGSGFYATDKGKSGGTGAKTDDKPAAEKPACEGCPAKGDSAGGTACPAANSASQTKSA